jgi:predicted nucleotidyltransferase
LWEHGGFVLFFGLEQHAAMSTTTDLAAYIIDILRAHEAELRRAGVLHLSLFGSVARGDAEAASDVDLAAEFDPAARMDLIRLAALERRLGEILGRRADLLPEPVDKARLRANIERDRRRAF